MIKNKKIGGGILLIIVGAFFISMFKDFKTTNEKCGIVFSAIIILFGLYGLYKGIGKKGQRV